MKLDITGKALLYAIPLFLAPFVDKLADLLLNDQWPSAPKLVGCALLGVVSASIGLRAYFDGSYERSKDVPIETMLANAETNLSHPPKISPGKLDGLENVENRPPTVLPVAAPSADTSNKTP
jgi:hypothetical protein